MNICTNLTASRRAPDEVNGTDSNVDWAQGQVTLRLGSTADDPQLTQLGTLDSSKPLTQPILLAELDGAVVAALSLSTGAGVADPLLRTVGLLELLRVRACQLALAA
jgi:hypothetical protein